MKIRNNNSEHYQGHYKGFIELFEANRIKEIKNKKRELYKYLIWTLVFIIVFIKEIIAFGRLSALISILLITMDMSALILCIKIITMDIFSIKILKSIKCHIETIELPVFIKFWMKYDKDESDLYVYIFEIASNEYFKRELGKFLASDNNIIKYETKEALSNIENIEYIANVTLPVFIDQTDEKKLTFINDVLNITIPQLKLNYFNKKF